tara:strand:- start:745 stop:855 length:111 start_codon:yes stop_codon:yes gene_type:complete
MSASQWFPKYDFTRTAKIKPIKDPIIKIKGFFIILI